jgi:flagellar basal-body rod modification protein FlgD
MTTAVTNTSSTSSSTASGKTTSSASEMSDRFLKLLVAQMKNQDPLNPTDNAQLTSQMAQINTVTGIDKLNETMTNMSTTFTQQQMLQGASLVGHQVLMEGNQLAINTSGKAVGGFELDAAASTVAIDIYNAAGVKVDTITQSGVSAGQQSFEWTPPSGTSTSGLTFKVTANSGGKSIKSTPIMTDMVDAVTNSNGTLQLELRNAGTTAYSKVKSIA